MNSYVYLWQYLDQFFLNEKCFRQKLYRKSKHKFYVRNFFSENHVVYEIIWKKCGKPDKPQMIQYGAFVLHVG
jgi:hypothetical protein